MATYLELCQSVRAQAGISGDGPSSVANQTGIMQDVVRWVAEAYAEIQTKYENWNYLHSAYTAELQGGQFCIDPSQLIGEKGTEGIRQITTDSFRVRESTDTPWKVLKYVPWSVWQISPEILKDDKRAVPEFYTEQPNGKLLFYPYQDAATDPLDNIDYPIKFQGYGRPHVMKNNSDIPIFHEQYAELIKLLALMRYAEYYNAMEVYQTADATFRQQIKKMEYSELPRDNLYTPPFVAFA